MSALSIWFKRANENKYHDITDYVVVHDKTLFTWNRKLYNKLYDFDLKLYSSVVDSSGVLIIPDIGDSIVISQNYNDLPYAVFGDNFAGIIESFEEEYQGLIDSETDFNVIYTIKVRNKNFSLNNITLKTLVSTKLSDMLTSVLSGVNELGGVNAFGFTIPKFYLNCNDDYIQPIDFAGSELNVISDILNILGFIFIIKYTLIQDITNNIRLVPQLWVIDPTLPNGSTTNDWYAGVTLQTYKDGVIDNIDYPNYDFNSYIITETEIKYSKDATNLRNFIKIQALIKNLSSGSLTRYVEIGNDKDTYTIGYSFDVKYVAIDIRGKIASLNTSGSPIITCTLSGLTAGANLGTSLGGIEYYQNRMNNNNLGGKMIGLIYSGGISYFCQFTISAGVLTFDGTIDHTILTIPSLANGDDFYLVNCFDVLKENLTSYPSDGNGYVIKSVGKEASTIKFTAFDAPYYSMPVVVYHYPIVTNYLSSIFTDNINTIGLRERSEKIDFPITQQQADILMNQYRKFNEPLETITLNNSYRKSLLNVGDQLSINFRRVNKNMMVTESSGKVLTAEGLYKDKPFIVQDITLATYVDTIEELLAQFANQSKVTQSQSLLNSTNLINYDSFSINLVNSSLTAPPLIDPVTQPTTNITSTGFRLNWLASNVPDYQIQISTDINFTNIIYSNQVNVAGLQGNPIYTDITFSGYGTMYFRIRALRGVEFSNWSSISFVQTITSFPSILPYAINLKFEEAGGQVYTDSSTNNNNGNGSTASTGLSSNPTRTGTSPHKAVTNDINSAIKVIDSTSLLTPNGGTWLFNIKRTTTPIINQTIYSQISANINSSNNRILIRILPSNVLSIQFWTPTISGKYIADVRATLTLTAGNYYRIGIMIDTANKNIVVVQDNNILTTSFFNGGAQYHTNWTNITSGLSTWSTPMFIGNDVDVIPSNLQQPLTDELHDFAIIKGDSANAVNTFLSAQTMKNIFNAMV